MAMSSMEQRVRALDDAGLQRMLAVDQSEWDPAALDVARDELERRGVPVLDADDYLDEHPEEELGRDGLCGPCEEDQLPIAPASVAFWMLFAVRLIPTGDPCEICRSRTARLWWPFLPIIPLGRYRIRGS